MPGVTQVVSANTGTLTKVTGDRSMCFDEAQRQMSTDLWWSYSFVSKFGKLSSGHRTGKGQFSFQSQRKAMPKDAQTTSQLLISHASKVMLKILQARLQQYVNCGFPDVQAGKFEQSCLEKAEDPEIKLPTSAGSQKKEESSRKHLFLHYWLCQSLWLCGSQ